MPRDRLGQRRARAVLHRAGVDEAAQAQAGQAHKAHQVDVGMELRTRHVHIAQRGFHAPALRHQVGAAAQQVQRQRGRQGRVLHFGVTGRQGRQRVGRLAAQLGQRMPRAGEDLLNGVLPCYNLYATQDGRTLAVGALEYKFWKLACDVFGRPDWAEQHWQRGVMPNTPASDCLKADEAQ